MRKQPSWKSISHAGGDQTKIWDDHDDANWL